MRFAQPLRAVFFTCLMCCFPFRSLLQAQEAIHGGSAEIAMQPLANDFLTVRASVAGHEGTFLFDTGGGVSYITPEFAAKTGCKPWGQSSGFRMTGERLDMQHCDGLSVRLGGYESAPVTLGVFDLAKVTPPSMRGIDGALALDLFASHQISFSYSRHLLRVLTPSQLARSTARQPPMPVHLVRDAEGLALTVDVPIPTAEGTAWFELDSGNNSSLVLVGKHLAGLFHLNPEGKSPEPVTLHLANGVSYTGPARVLNLILDGNLGTSFLAQNDVIFDLANAKAWVTPAAKAGQ